MFWETGTNALTQCREAIDRTKRAVRWRQRKVVYFFNKLLNMLQLEAVVAITTVTNIGGAMRHFFEPMR
jgi:hypothetical protein